MIIELFIRLLVNFLCAFEAYIYPAFPDEVGQVMNTMFSYMINGLKWVFAFLDVNYISTLFSWWIVVTSALLIFEIVKAVWNLVTGNDVSENVKYESADN